MQKHVFGAVIGATSAILSTQSYSDTLVSSAGGVGNFLDPNVWTVVSTFALPGDDFPAQTSQGSFVIADGSVLTLNLDDFALQKSSELIAMDIGAADRSEVGAPVQTNPTGSLIVNGNGSGEKLKVFGFIPVVGGADNADTGAEGNLTVNDADFQTGILVVGFNESTDLTSVANGTVVVDGQLEGTVVLDARQNGTSLTVGRTTGPTGSAIGEVTVNSLKSNWLSVGVAETRNEGTSPPPTLMPQARQRAPSLWLTAIWSRTGSPMSGRCAERTEQPTARLLLKRASGFLDYSS